MPRRDTEHWRLVGQTEPRISWLDRSEAAAHLIRPSDVVCDLGAGAQTLRRFLPPSTGYIPVDCVKSHPDTWVADLSGDFVLPDRPFNVITAIGLISHLKDMDAFFARLASTQAGKFLVLTTHPGPDYSMTPEKWLLRLEPFLDSPTYVARLDRSWIMCGTLDPKKDKPAARRNRTMNKLVGYYTPPHAYAVHKLDLALRVLRRGGNNGSVSGPAVGDN